MVSKTASPTYTQQNAALVADCHWVLRGFGYARSEFQTNVLRSWASSIFYVFSLLRLEHRSNLFAASFFFAVMFTILRYIGNTSDRHRILVKAGVSEALPGHLYAFVGLPHALFGPREHRMLHGPADRGRDWAGRWRCANQMICLPPTSGRKPDFLFACLG